MIRVICVLPKAGLANQFFLIASAELFAYKNGQEVEYKNKWQFRLGPYLRMERSKRNYFGFFKFQHLSFKKTFQLFSPVSNFVQIYDPSLNFIPQNKSKIIFKSLPHWSTYFNEYIPYRSLVKNLIFNQLSERIKNQINELPEIDVAIHVRLGDFQKVKSMKFEYYIDAISKIKNKHPEYLFYIFTDGFKEELSPLLDLKNIFWFDSVNDIVDLYQMSKSKILITTPWSTYSYWAGFLGDCEIVQSESHKIKIK